MKSWSFLKEIHGADDYEMLFGSLKEAFLQLSVMALVGLTGYLLSLIFFF
jgi:hypothetical protein